MSKSDSVSFFLVGDFCSSSPEMISISPELREVMDGCDYRALNFEGPLSTEEFKGVNKTILGQSQNSPEWCKNNGFELVSLANNHMLDYGEEGLSKTKYSFSECLTLGAGRWEEAYKVHYVECNGLRIGLFAASSADLAALQDKWTEGDRMGCCWINHPSVNGIITEAKKQCDFLILFVHAGVEFMSVPLPEWRDRYKELIDNGADAIVASHPHIVQGLEVYNKRPIFYSLGNFFFDYYESDDKKPDSWDHGLAIRLHLDAKNGITYDYYPTIKVGQSISIDNTETIKKQFEQLCDLLGSVDDYMSSVNMQVTNFYDKYKLWLISGFGALDMSQPLKYKLKFAIERIRDNDVNYLVPMHQIREESTRWLLIRAMRLKTRKTNND